jgi:Niemann-Pick C1 protein
MLEDLRLLCNSSGLPGTFSYGNQYFNYETYVVFKKELTLNVTLALLAVFVVVLSITINFVVSFMIVSCVVLVDLFLFGILAYWNLTLNHITIINIVMAIGLAVDYSAHIGHAYLQASNDVYNRHGDIMTNHQ